MQVYVQVNRAAAASHSSVCSWRLIQLKQMIHLNLMATHAAIDWLYEWRYVDYGVGDIIPQQRYIELYGQK